MMPRFCRMVLVPLTVVVMALGGAACASAGHSNETIMVQLDHAMKHYATLLRGAPADSVAAAYAENGALVLPGMKPLEGRVAIRDFLAPMIGTVVVSSVTITTDRVKASADGLTSDGNYTQFAAAKGDPSHKYTGGFHAQWVPTKDHHWLLLRLEMYPDPPKP